MDYFIYTFLSGVFFGILSIIFRYFELKNKTTFLGRQFLLQIFIFFIFVFIYGKYFYFYSLDLGFLNLNWFWVFFIVSSVSFYMIQIVYEYIIGNKLFPSEEELFSMGLIDNADFLLKDLLKDISILKDSRLKKKLLKDYELLKQSRKTFSIYLNRINNNLDDYYKKIGKK